MKLGSDVDLRKLAEDTELFTGAELEGLCKEVGVVALREDINATVVRERHFQIAKASLKPSLTVEEIDSYSSFMRTTSQTRTTSQALPRQRWNPLSLVKVGVVSCILVAAAKYYITQGDQIIAT